MSRSVVALAPQHCPSCGQDMETCFDFECSELEHHAEGVSCTITHDGCGCVWVDNYEYDKTVIVKQGDKHDDNIMEGSLESMQEQLRLMKQRHHEDQAALEAKIMARIMSIAGDNAPDLMKAAQ